LVNVASIVVPLSRLELELIPVLAFATVEAELL